MLESHAKSHAKKDALIAELRALLEQERAIRNFYMEGLSEDYWCEKRSDWNDLAKPGQPDNNWYVDQQTYINQAKKELSMEFPHLFGPLK